MLIDFHTHAFPEKIAERAIASLEQNIIDVSGDGPWAHAKHGGTVDALKQSMHENGVDISVVMPIATTLTQSTSINRFAAEINGHDGLYSFGSLHPLQENAEAELENIKSLGLKGIKLHPEYQKFYINSAESIRVLKKAEELGLYVLLHAGEDAGMMPPFHCTPELLADALGHLSGGNIIAAHMGGYNLNEDFSKLLAGSNIFIDTSYCLDKIPVELAEGIIKKHGANRVLFGSDSPWEKPQAIIDGLKRLNLTQEEFDMITFKNAAEILGI